MKENKYFEMKERHQKEFNEFPMKFAFDEVQFAKAMKELGLKPHQKDKIYSIGMGGFIRREDSAKLQEMNTRHDREINNAIAEDATGEGFITDMFDYELGNHEYVITYEVDDTLDALGLTHEMIERNPILKNALDKACKLQLKNYNEREDF